MKPSREYTVPIWGGDPRYFFLHYYAYLFESPDSRDSDYGESCQNPWEGGMIMSSMVLIFL